MKFLIWFQIKISLDYALLWILLSEGKSQCRYFVVCASLFTHISVAYLFYAYFKHISGIPLRQTSNMCVFVCVHVCTCLCEFQFSMPLSCWFSVSIFGINSICIFEGWIQNLWKMEKNEKKAWKSNPGHCAPECSSAQCSQI